MKKLLLFTLLIGIVLVGCTFGTNHQSVIQKTDLSVQEFTQKATSLQGAVVLDVRTLEEFKDGHVENAINIDWTSNYFEEKAASLDKEKPVFVYCLSGARSAEAADFLRSKGFKSVYNMEGGIMAWRAANLPIAETAEKVAGMSMEQYNQLIQTDKTILIDFYADWCAPCKKMEPYLKEIATEQAGKVELVRINADDNTELCQALGVDALPTLKVYKKGKQTWSNVGYIDKPNVVKQL